MANQRVQEGRLFWFLLPALSPRVMGFCFFGVSYYLAYFFGMAFSQACASPFWFPDAILLCALLLTSPRNWWLFVLATFPIRLLSPISHGIPVWFLLATSAIDAGRGLAVAALLRVFLRNPLRIETVKEFVVFCVIAALLVPAVSAFVAAGILHAMGKDYWAVWEQWFMGDALVHLVLTPATVYWLFMPPGKMKLPRGKNLAEAVLLAIGLVVTSWLAFSTSVSAIGLLETRYYFPVPLLFWAAIRFGMLGASVGVVTITIFSVNAAVHGHGSFYGLSASETSLLLQQYLLLRAVPVYLVAILIQQKENAEHSLRESERRFRDMADTAPVMIWTTRADKSCDFVNRGWLEFTGRKLDQEYGNGWQDSLHPEDVRRNVDIYYTAFDTRQPFVMEYRLRRHDGEYRWVLDRGVPRYAPSGEFLGYVGSVVDMTDRRLAEEARQELVHASRLAVLGEFTAIVSHELNQPLSTILVNADAMSALLESQTVPVNEAREIVEEIRREDLRATETIRRIRSLACKHQMEMQPLDVNQTVSEVVRLAEGDASRRGVQIVEEYCENEPVVWGDIVHLQQVILNLIINAMDAMGDSPIMERRMVVRTAFNGNGVAEVSVRDNGPGIPSENLLRVFESFFTTKTHGIGLGLSISRSIVQLHAGRLWAENNNPGKGATFRFTLPRAVRSPAQTQPYANGKECLAEKV